ncbi:alpha/beta hydrolase fold domain-containing protein [Mitsuaria sp. 7]|uniref:alpha/beta hydrolase fold domain-containing protein n=1 Tax=Mitsuaria sp. 7 TaxID=1658665 RepID=UPI0007DCF271|nr:alpha/beta hydrolase fold domain-containing protein [Mitsuaria sp. 7]ANH67461.1 alpha/beta hydrolase [Mitsuaria sp. 7]
MNPSYLVSPGQSLSEFFRPDAISADTRAVNEKLAGFLATLQAPADLAGLRDAYVRGGLGLPASPKSPSATTMTIAGPAGPVELRILVPEVVRGVYLHLHGGGWMLGSNDTWDEPLEMFGREAGLVSVSVNYRLAPEHVFPAAVDDGVAAASWLIEHAQRLFGSSWLAIGGESAGANLAALTLLRLRDEGRSQAFRAANLLFGCFDLSQTPSVRKGLDSPLVNRDAMAHFASAFAGTRELQDPALSPLYADLSDLPPALFTVGTMDLLLDDSLFMHSRWQAAGNEARLAIYPGGIHGFNSLGGALADAANLGMAHFLARVREEDR